MNPTIFKITDPLELFDAIDPQDKQLWQMTNEMLEEYKVLYGSYFRRNEVWDKPVFVCPFCIHATLEDISAEGSMEPDQYYCKYCSSYWSFDVKKGFLKIIDEGLMEHLND